MQDTGSASAAAHAGPGKSIATPAATARTDPDFERGLQARALYQDGCPLTQIIARTGLSLGGIYEWLDGGPPGSRDAQGRPLRRLRRRRTPARRRLRRVPVADRVSLVNRLWLAAERQAAEIESRLRHAGGEDGVCERDAKTLAVLARTVRELIAIDASGNRPDAAASETDQDDAIPRDLDALREALAHRIGQLRAERAAGAAGPPGEG